MREVESCCNPDGIDGAGDAGTGAAVGMVRVDSMRRVFLDGLKGVVNGVVVSVSEDCYAHTTLPPLPPIQVKRVEVQRGKTLQERTRTQDLWWGEGLTKRGKLRDWKEVSEQGVWNVTHTGGVGLQKRAASGPFMNDTIWSFQSTESPFLCERAIGNGLGSTTSSLVQSICTVRKRCTGVPAGGAPSTAASGPSTQTVKPIKLERPQDSRDGLLLQHSGNAKARVNEVRGVVSNKKCSGQSLYEFRKTECLNTASTDCRSSKNKIPVRSGRQEDSPNCKIANPLAFENEEERQKHIHPQRQHWWKDLMKGGQPYLAAPENLDRLGVPGINGTGKIGIGSRRASDSNKFVGLIPPAGTPVGRKRARTLQSINTKAEDTEKGLKFVMRGARSYDCDRLSKARSEGFDKIQNTDAFDDGKSSVGSAGPQRQERQAMRLRGFGSDDTSLDGESVGYLIATSWSSRENTNTAGARIGARPLLPYSTIPGNPVTKTSCNLKRMPFTPLSPGINNSVYEFGSSFAETNTGVTSTPIVAPQPVPTTLYSVTPPTRAYTAAHVPPLVPPDSIPSIGIPNARYSITPHSHAHLQFFTHHPLTITTGTPTLPCITLPPTRQPLLQKLYEPQIKPYGSLLLPPLSRVLYEKWKKHSTPLCQKEPSAEEGLQLGQGHGGRERDRWLRLRSASYEGEDGREKLLTGGLRRRFSDPGVRRCVQNLWMYVVDLARKSEGGCPSHQVVIENSDKAMLQQRSTGQVYFPEWFSPGWGSGDEEVYCFLHGDDTPAMTEDEDDPDVEFVLRHVARQKYRDITELLRGFSEETFLSEVNSRLEWWWWQTRGSAAGICGREAERRRGILLQLEGRGQNTSLKMEKEYSNAHFKVELDEGVKWGQEWRWELDVPNGVRDVGAYCYPHPPRNAGGWYVGAKSGSVQGTTKYRKIERQQPGLRCMYNIDRIRRTRPSRQRMLEQVKRIVKGEEKTKWEKLREVRRRWEKSDDLSATFSNELEAPLVRRKEQPGHAMQAGNGVSDSSESSLPTIIAGSAGELTTTHFETAVSSILDDQSYPDLGHFYVSSDGDKSALGSSNTVNFNINRVNPQPANYGMSPSGIFRPRGKGMTLVLQYRRRRHRAQGAFSGVGVGGSGVGGCSYLLRSKTSSLASPGSGYIAGDEDPNPSVTLQLSSQSPTSLNLTAGINATSSMCFKPENRIFSFATDTSETSLQSVGRVDNFIPRYEGEWDRSLCSLRDSTEGEDKDYLEICEGSGVYEIQNGSASESDEMELECVELEGEDSDDGVEKLEVSLIPEDVRGSWGRNGGYLGLDSMRTKVPGVKRYKRKGKGLLDSEVSVPGWGSSSGPSPPGQRQIPWFLSLRSLRMPETSSGTGGDMNSDKETRRLERMKEFGRKVREVSGANMEALVMKGLRAADSQEVVEAENARGTTMDREGDCEMGFWGISIRKGVEGLFGPVKDVGAELYMEELD